MPVGVAVLVPFMWNVCEYVFVRLKDGETMLPVIAVPVKLAVARTREVSMVALADGTGITSVSLTVTVPVDCLSILDDCLRIDLFSSVSTYKDQACWR